ncbi:uncharacterized protein LOC135849249 [Planococcus citri]|uniref:uncharacterized protein LOC135849249 n=1 Tax=Planococcus citri TaxID=170843 RepID=UPI0031F8B6E2
MTNATTFAAIYLYFWLIGGLTGIFCIKESTNGSSTIKNQTIKAEKRTLIGGSDRISQTERNRRLIPYATYYIAGSSASAAGGSLDQENSLLSTAAPTQSTEEQDQEDPVQSKRPLKIPYKAAENNEYYDYQDTNEYSYIPVAYIPGAGPSRGINYNPETHYYPNSYYQSPISTENAKYLYPTAKPTAKPTQQPVSTTTDRKFPFSYLTKYVAQQSAQDDYYKYLVTPATLKHQINYEIKKPAGVASAAAAAYYSGDVSSAVVSTPAPQSEYLNFRYNLYKTQAPKYDVTTTPSTVEITSPKHYLVNKVVSSTYPSQGIAHVTTPYAVTYDYPEEQYAAHTQTAKPVTKIPEQVTQSTKTLMTIMKSQELPYHLQQQQQHLQQLHHHHHHPHPHHNIPTRIQFVPKPYLVPTINTPTGGAAVIDYTVDDILAGYNINKQLPEKITADNIKQSIKTLSYILQVLQKADSISHYTNKPHTSIAPHFNSKEIFDSLKESPHSAITPIEHNSVSPLPHHVHSYDPYDDTPKEPIPTTPFVHKAPLKDDQSTPGRAGIDYPVLSVIPETTFNCKTQRYKGFFADPETKCQVWHYCDLNGGQASFLCPNGTIFNQAALTCDWWFNVKCAATPQLYVLNERLYKYIIPVRPSFPEDYSGPLVDQYLTEKFKEIESQRKHKYPTNTTTSKIEAAANLTALSEYDIPSHLLDENL